MHVASIAALFDIHLDHPRPAHMVRGLQLGPWACHPPESGHAGCFGSWCRGWWCGYSLCLGRE